MRKQAHINTVLTAHLVEMQLVRRVHHVVKVNGTGVGGGAPDQHIVTSDPEPILLGKQSILFR